MTTPLELTVIVCGSLFCLLLVAIDAIVHRKTPLD